MAKATGTLPRMGASAVVGIGGLAWYMGWLDGAFKRAGWANATMGQPPPHEVYPDPFYVPKDFKSMWPEDSAEMLKMLRKHGQTMTKIDLRRTHYAEARMLHLVSEFASNAQELRIHDTVGTVTDMDLTRTLLKMPFLRVLELVRIDEGVTDEVIRAALEICKDLETLRISGAGGYERKGLTEGAVKEIARRVGKRLKHLELSEDMPVTDAALLELAVNCPNLELLNIRSGWNTITDEGVLEVLKRCPKVQQLDVAGMNGITSTLLAHISVPELAPSLRVLKVTPFAQGGRVDDQGIADLRLLRPEVQVYERTTEGGIYRVGDNYNPFTEGKKE